MSQISVLGFTPTSSTSTLFSSSIHWAILISPDPTVAKNRPQPTNFTVLDIHDHQLRQQPWPIPVVEDEIEGRYCTAIRPLRRPSPTPSSILNFQTPSSRSASPVPSSTPTNASTTTTTTTLNATSQHPLRLSLKICIGTLAQRPSKLLSKLHKLLQTTPTYGLEEDWLRSALVVMHEQLSVLDPGFDVDGFIAYAGEAAKEYLSYSNNATKDDDDQVVPDVDRVQVLELDYLAHVRRNDQVKALLSQHPQFHRRGVHHKSPHVRHRYHQSPPPRYSPSALTSDRNEATSTLPPPAPAPPSLSSVSSPSLQLHGSSCHSFGGMRRWVDTLRKFHVSPSPTQLKHRNPHHLQPWQRRDDPYGGLM